MKTLIVIVLTLMLAAVLVVGNLHWNSRSSEKTSTPAITNSDTNTEAEPEIDTEYYLEFAANWPEEAKEQLQKKLNSNETFQIVLLGSDSIGSDTLGLKSNLKEALSEKYEKNVELESIVYENTTTDYVLNSENEKLVDLKPDMIIFEPFLLNDNNVVAIPNTISNISSIIEETTVVLPDVTFILQPPNQIYDANLYPMQVTALQEYAHEQNLTYLNHWEVWPAGNDVAVNEYLNADARPNESGFKLWSDYLSEYLISE
ncbi:hypothetical protein [Niallia sp. BSM11]|uniref:hypothetical protein n=1 Tax=Niallia sp. BSM11 TaxID=3391576 RepID=UPI003984971C